MTHGDSTAAAREMITSGLLVVGQRRCLIAVLETPPAAAAAALYSRRCYPHSARRVTPQGGARA